MPLHDYSSSTNVSGIVASGTKTSDTTITHTGEADADTIATAAAFTADGSTTYWIDFSCAGYSPGSGTQKFYVYEGSSSVGQAVAYNPGSGAIIPICFRAPVTPAAGSRTYSVRCATSGGGTGTAFSGAGGNGAVMPAIITVSR